MVEQKQTCLPTVSIRDYRVDERLLEAVIDVPLLQTRGDGKRDTDTWHLQPQVRR
jgi:hypothetical protein